MKLLDEISSATVPRPTQRRVWATLSITLLVVILATYVGYSMLTGEGSERDPDAPVPMSVWVEEASSTCMRVAEEHSVLTQGSDVRLSSDNLAAVEAGIGELDAGIRDLPPPEDADDAERVAEIAGLGGPAVNAWQELVEDDSVSEEELSEASSLTSAYIGGLVDLGVQCSVLD